MKKSKHESVHTLFWFFFYGMSSVGYNHNIVQRYIAEGKVGGVLFFCFLFTVCGVRLRKTSVAVVVNTENVEHCS